MGGAGLEPGDAVRTARGVSTRGVDLVMSRLLRDRPHRGRRASVREKDPAPCIGRTSPNVRSQHRTYDARKLRG
jgi:hypothetical protein